jgi:arylsulfatase A-like enzyme
MWKGYAFSRTGICRHSSPLSVVSMNRVRAIQQLSLLVLVSFYTSSFIGFEVFLGATEPVVANGRPNIVLINLDDADREMFKAATLEKHFPEMAAISKRGITFTNFHVTTPLCGPSRACLLRGQYAHALQHRTNDMKGSRTRGFQGDFSSYFEKGYFDDDLGTWMKTAGYHTVFVGKYMNHVNFKNSLPAGWDDYYRSQGSKYYLTQRFTNRFDKKGAIEKIPPGHYRTNVEANDVVRVILDRRDDVKPMFVYFAPFGPHSEGKADGGMIDQQDAGLWRDIVEPQTADYDEENITDKPKAYQQLPRLSEELKAKLKTDYRNRMLATKSIDRAIGRITQALEATGKLANTYIFITSDNGYSLGSHRLSGKGNTMTRSSHVPLIVCGPNINSAQSASHLLAHIDLAPTFLEIAAGEQKSFFDGKSFAPLLTDPPIHAERIWRTSILIENWQARKFMQFTLPTTFCQLRLYDSVYTEWADGSREYYELDQDPLELKNIYKSLSTERANALSLMLQALRHPLPEPIATVERPPQNNTPITGPPFAIRGVAEDSSGIDRVELVIRKWSTNEYWNGNQWQPKRVSLRANLRNPGGLQTEWTYSFKAPIPEVISEGYNVIPRAYANNGSYTRQVVIRKFQFDSFPPTTIINQIRLPAKGRVRVVGRSRDNHGVREVRVHLLDVERKQYFNGTRWTEENQFLTRQTDENDKWEFFTPQLAPGNYLIRARAYDVAGNWDPTQAVRRFKVEPDPLKQ